MTTEQFNKYLIFEKMNAANYNLMECLINGSSDEEVLKLTEALICDLLETIPYYEMKEFRVTLANSFRI